MDDLEKTLRDLGCEINAPLPEGCRKCGRPCNGAYCHDCLYDISDYDDIDSPSIVTPSPSIVTDSCQEVSLQASIVTNSLPEKSIVTKKCRYCECDFQPNRLKQVFCSNKCRIYYFRKR